MKKTARGFAIISAIFLLVTLAALGAFMLTLSNTQQVTSTQDLQGLRAYRAARMGMEWAAAAISAAPTACPTGSAASPWLTLDKTPDGFTVVVACTLNADPTGATLYNEGTGVDRRIFWITSTASSGGAVGGIGYTERQLSAFMEF